VGRVARVGRERPASPRVDERDAERLFSAVLHLPASGIYKIEDAANELLVQLRTSNNVGEQPPLSHQQIIFIAHSTGGIVVRDLLERNRDEFSGKKIGLVLMASPSRGSAWADRLQMLSRMAGNKMAQQLSPGNDYLTNLDKRFADFVQRPPFELYGIDLFENRFIIPGRFKLLNSVLQVERVVEPNAQSSYFGSPKIVPDTDHFSVVKPGAASHPSHQFLVDYVEKVFAKTKR
jgi:pimeloyl-ACP methyl ester carboxylesterase